MSAMMMGARLDATQLENFDTNLCLRGVGCQGGEESFPHLDHFSFLLKASVLILYVREK